MNITTSQVTKLMISGLPDLDPIAVIVEDFGPGQGKITFNCCNDAWSAYWVHMGEHHTMRSFFSKCDTPYLIGKLAPGMKDIVNDFDETALTIPLQKEVLESRKAGFITKEEAAHQWDEANCVTIDNYPDVYQEIIGDGWWLFLPTKTNEKYIHLSKIVETVKQALAMKEKP